MKPSINRALIFQGGGSLGAYEAGAYKAINENTLEYFQKGGGEIKSLCLISFLERRLVESMRAFMDDHDEGN